METTTIQSSFIPLSPSYLLKDSEEDLMIMDYNKEDFKWNDDDDLTILTELLSTNDDTSSSSFKSEEHLTRPAESTRDLYESLPPRTSKKTNFTDRPITLCRYKSHKCPNPRAFRKDGRVMLRLCEYHRKHQNEAKKRSDMKLKRVRSEKRRQELLSQHYQMTAANSSLPDSATIIQEDIQFDYSEFNNTNSVDTNIFSNDDGSVAAFGNIWQPDDIDMLLYYTS